MKQSRVVLIFAALFAATPTFAANTPSAVITTGSWTASKPAVRSPRSSNAAHMPIMAGSWTPSKPSARPSVANMVRVPVTTGHSASSKPWGRPAGSR
jgi:hypothetical protein